MAQKQTYFIELNANSFTIPTGFVSAVITNDGAADIVLTNMIAQTYVVKAGEVFRWKEQGSAYMQIEVDATASSGRLAYTF